MRTRWLFNIIAIILIALALARLAARRQPVSSRRPDSRGKLLEAPVPAVHLANASLAQVALELERASGVKIIVDSSAKESPHARVTLDCAPSTLGEDLQAAVLAADPANLTLLVRNGEVHILSPSAVPQTLRVYDVRDLFARLVDECPPDDGSYLPTPGVQVYAPQLPTSVTAPTRQQIAEKYASDAIINLVTSIVPDTWSSNGGIIPSPTISHGWMLIVQTSEAHDQIEQLLADLRQAARGGSQVHSSR